MVRKISQEGLDLIKQWEGLRLQAYTDICGKLTVGYGHTNDAGTPPNVYEGLTISERDAEDILRQDLLPCEETVSTLVKVPLNDPQFSTLVSFCYNVGTNSFQKSTLLRKLNLGQYDIVPKELMKWTKSGGKIAPGLVNRRAAEAGLWVRGSYVSSNYHATDKRSVDYKRCVEIVTPAVTAVSGLGSMAMHNPPIQYALACVMILGALLGTILFFKRMKDDQL